MELTPFEDLWLVASNLGLGVPALYALKKLGYVDHFFCLTAPISQLRAPRLRTDLHVAEATEADLEELRRGVRKLDPEARREVLARLVFRHHGMPGCHVGRNDRGEVVSLQWLLRPCDRPWIDKHLRRLYSPLRDHEVLLENIFVFPAFRGMGAFATVNHLLLERARREGFRVATTYVRKDKIDSLNGFLDQGFRIRSLVRGYSVAGVSWRTTTEPA